MADNTTFRESDFSGSSSDSDDLQQQTDFADSLQLLSAEELPDFSAERDAALAQQNTGSNGGGLLRRVSSSSESDFGLPASTSAGRTTRDAAGLITSTSGRPSALRNPASAMAGNDSALSAIEEQNDSHGHSAHLRDLDSQMDDSQEEEVLEGEDATAQTPTQLKQQEEDARMMPPPKFGVNGKTGGRRPGRAIINGSVAASTTSSTAGPAHSQTSNRQTLTLREQEKVIDLVKKENFSLKLKIYFLEERLAKLAPEHIDSALKENIELKVDFQTLQQELKKHKRMCLELNRAVESLQSERDSVAPSNDREELEEELRSAKADLDAMKQRSGKQRSEVDWESEDARAEISRLRDELQAEREAKEEIMYHNKDLESRLRKSGADLRSSARSRASLDEDEGRTRSRRSLERRVEELRQDNATLLKQLDTHVSQLSARNAEKERLYDDIENLKADNMELEAELSVHHASGAALDAQAATQNLDGRIASMQDEINHYRDKTSSIMLEMERKESEIEDLLQDGDARDVEVENLRKDWQAELDHTRAQRDEAREILREREQELKAAGEHLGNFQDKLREAEEEIDHLVKELQAKEDDNNALNDELDAAVDDINKHGARVQELEEELDARENHVADLSTNLQTANRDLENQQILHNGKVDALKDKYNTLKIKLADLKAETDDLRNQVEDAHSREDEMAERLENEQQMRKWLENLKEELERNLRRLEKEHVLEIESKNKTISQANTAASQAKKTLETREADLEKVQNALRKIEGESKRLGQSHVNDRSSLQLEVERLRRDLKNSKGEVDLANLAVENAEDRVARLTSEVKDLSTQLAASTQTRLALTQKLDQVTKVRVYPNVLNTELSYVGRQSLDDAKSGLSSAKDRASLAESHNSKDSRASGRLESQYKEQLSERNNLLQTISQMLEKLLGSDKSSARAGLSDPKPSSNFLAFHDLLLSRLKQMASIRNTFDRRIREVDTSTSDKYESLKRQYDSRMRQLDRFEAAIKTAADVQRSWKHRVAMKQQETETAKNTIAELQAQISALKGRVPSGSGEPGSATKIQSLSAKASTAERRLLATQNQLELAEEKLDEARQKVSTAEGRWEARLKELEQRCRAAEEKTKRERQGGKERVAELLQQVKSLEKQVGGANKRKEVLGDLVARVQQ